MIKYLLAIIALLFFTNTNFGCSLYIKPISDFDPAHFVFIGEIVEVFDVDYGSQIIKSQIIKYKAVGFKVKILENIYSPKQAAYLEVFPLSLTPGCSLVSETKRLREMFLVGSQVRIVAKEATMFKNQPVDDSIIRLETSIFNRGSFSRNDLRENLRSSGKSFYEYGDFLQMQRKLPAEDVLIHSAHYLPEFELRKDLLRLKETKSEDEKTRILERLVFYPHVHRLDYPKVVRAYIKNRDKIEVLEKQWEQKVQEIYSKQR